MSQSNESPVEALEHVEHQELLTPSRLGHRERSNSSDENSRLTRTQAWNLYTSHLLSTWNARTYEFAAIIFTATAYPDTLIASAIRGIITTISSILFSASIGRWIDHAPSRLKTLLTTITANRCSVIAACVGWVLIVGTEYAGPGPREQVLLPKSWVQEPVLGFLKGTLFAAVLLLGVLEKLSGAANMMSMERDWVVTVANPDGQAYDLTHLNAVMRRIDLICKLVAPIMISVIISGTGSVRFGVLVVGAMNAISWLVEWWSARRVWNSHPRLQWPKSVPAIAGDANSSVDNVGLPHLTGIQSRGHSLLEKSTQWIQRAAQDFIKYFSSDVWVPSIALSLLHLSVLSYSATFVTYLLSAGFSLNLITLARAIGSVVEISSTVVTPFGVSYLGKARHHHHHHHSVSDQDDFSDEEADTALLEHSPTQYGSTETGLERLGLWGIIWQLLNLIPVVLSLWALSGPSSESNPSIAFPLLSRILPANMISSPILLPLSLFTFLSLSRLGLWIYDLTTQQLTQTLVPQASRASFSGVESSFVAFFELGQHIATIVLNKPEEFKWLALGSLCAVGVSSASYAGWLRGRRGHLVHWDRLAGLGGKCRRIRMRSRVDGGRGRVEEESGDA